jgi:hypothetical protein
MSLPVLLFPTYEDALAFSNRVGLYVHVHDDPNGQIAPWGPVYAETYDNQGVPLETPPTQFGVQWDEFMDTAVWTIPTTAPFPEHAVDEPLLTPEELAAEKPWILRYAVVRGNYNGGTWVEYTPPAE